jgi:hypothetical protein
MIGHKVLCKLEPRQKRAPGFDEVVGFDFAARLSAQRAIVNKRFINKIGSACRPLVTVGAHCHAIDRINDQFTIGF